MIDAADVEAVLEPFLEMITDERLKHGVIKAWLAGCHRGGWASRAELERMPFTLLTDCRGITFIEHTLAVTAGALGLAKAQETHYRAMPYAVDYNRLIAGGLLHDVGKLLEIEPDGAGGFRKSRSGRCARHPISGTVLAAEAGLPDEILNVIACHAKEGEGRPQTLETVFIHQADFATFDPLTMLVKDLLIQ